MKPTPSYHSINEVNNDVEKRLTPKRHRRPSSRSLLSPVILDPNNNNISGSGGGSGSNNGLLSISTNNNNNNHNHHYRTIPLSPSPSTKHRRGSEVDHRTIIKLFLTTCFILISLFCFNRFLYFWSYVHESISIDDARRLIKDIPSTLYLKDHLNYFGSQKRLAGSIDDQSLANLTLLKWQEFGMTDLQIETFYPTLNKPLYHEISILDQQQSSSSILYQTSHSIKDSSIPFHAYSKDGNVTGPIVYVNYGTINDFNYLIQQGIQLNGTIALIRGGGEMDQASIMTGTKVMLAEKHGCIGVLIYADPGDMDGPVEHKKEQDAYPNGPWRPNYSVPYASVMNKAIMVGDPWSSGVGIPSTHTDNDDNKHQQNKTNVLPNIPSLPISWDQASQLLKLTNGYGILDPPQTWQGGDNQQNTILFHSGPSSTRIRLINQNLYQAVPIENVIARIPGQIDTFKSIIIGCQRDSFSSSGIIESASSSAIMHELVRTLGQLLKKGWRPNRSIILISWDASSYGLVGSTEWVELHKEWVYEQSIAYIDVGSVSGNLFDAQGSPLLHRLLYQVTQDVFDPQQSQSIYDAWKKNKYISSPPSSSFITTELSSTCITNITLHQQQEEDGGEEEGNKDDSSTIQYPYNTVLIDPLKVNNDGFAFFQHVGVPTLSLRFKSNQFGVSNSEEDNLDWMNKFGDSTFTYHQAMVRIVGLLTLRLSSEQLLPMYPTDYASLLLHYADELSATHDCRPLPSLTTSLLMLQSSSGFFYRKAEKYRRQLKVKQHYSKKLKKHMKRHNQAVTRFERSFLDPLGSPSDDHRPWLKHAIYSPQLDAPTTTILFPSIVHAIQKQDPVYTRQMEERVTAMIMTAHDTLHI